MDRAQKQGENSGFKLGGRLWKQERYENAVKADFPRNAAMILCWETSYGLGLSFALFYTMVPAYLVAINSPKVIIGIVSSLLIILTPTQLISAHFLANKPRKKWLFFSFESGFLPWALFGILNLAFANYIPDLLRFIWFVLTISWFALIVTCSQAPVLALLTDCVPLKKRGAMYGYRISGLAIALLITSPVARYILNHFPEPTNYHICFAIGPVFYCISSFFLLAFREHRDPRTSIVSNTHPEMNKFGARLKLLFRRLSRNPNFRISAFFLVLLFIPMQFGSFVVAYTREQAGVPASKVLGFSIIQMICGALGGLVLGRIADRLGYKIVGALTGMIIAIAFAVVAAAVVLENSMTMTLIYVGFGLNAFSYFVTMMVLTNLSVELIPTIDRSMLLGGAFTMMMPFNLIVLPLCGWIIDFTGSYMTIFILGSALATVSCFGFTFLVREPRKNRMYAVRPVRRF